MLSSQAGWGWDIWMRPQWSRPPEVGCWPLSDTPGRTDRGACCNGADPLGRVLADLDNAINLAGHAPQSSRPSGSGAGDRGDVSAVNYSAPQWSRPISSWVLKPRCRPPVSAPWKPQWSWPIRRRCWLESTAGLRKLLEALQWSRPPRAVLMVHWDRLDWSQEAAAMERTSRVGAGDHAGRRQGARAGAAMESPPLGPALVRSKTRCIAFNVISAMESRPLWADAGVVPHHSSSSPRLQPQWSRPLRVSARVDVNAGRHGDLHGFTMEPTPGVGAGTSGLPTVHVIDRAAIEPTPRVGTGQFLALEPPDVAGAAIERTFWGRCWVWTGPRSVTVSSWRCK